MSFYEEQGDYLQALAFARKLLQGDPTRQTIVPIPDEVQAPQGADVLQFAWGRLIADFVCAIRTGDKGHHTVPHLPTLEDGLRTQEVMAAAKLAEAERRWVTIAEVA